MRQTLLRFPGLACTRVSSLITSLDPRARAEDDVPTVRGGGIPRTCTRQHLRRHGREERVRDERFPRCRWTTRKDGNDDDVGPLDFLTNSAVGLSEMEGVRVASMKVWTEEERGEANQVLANMGDVCNRKGDAHNRECTLGQNDHRLERGYGRYSEGR